MRSGHDKVNDNPAAPLTERERRILGDADLCVKCGLCLPHCPTYLKVGDEGESPRGRIALAQGVATGQLPVSPGVRAHLASCLACRACESVCPSRVPYGRLIDAARAELSERRPPGATARALRWVAAEGVVGHPRATGVALGLLRRYQGSVLEQAVRRGRTGRWLGLQRAARYLPPVGPASEWRSFYPSAGQERGRVALFLGCVARAFDRQTLSAAVRVLNQVGYGVHVPSGQACCGAIHLHAGAPGAALRLARKNLDAFAADAVEAVVTTASGCGATLAEYAALPGLSTSGGEDARRFAAKVVDISRFLARQPAPELRPLRARGAVHDPCSLRNVMAQREGPYALLAMIPGLEVVELPGNAGCCGAAGTHMLTHPKLADRLAQDKRDALAGTGADILMTSNLGCALHLSASLREAASRVEVLHPVTLLARQMGAL